MARVLILAGDAAESLEVLYPYQRLREEGYEVHIAAPSIKPVIVTTCLISEAPPRARPTAAGLTRSLDTY